jgi:hypothetical protein
VVREAEAQQRSEFGRLEQEKALLEHRIQELSAFERDYRTKLKAYIETFLEDLNSSATTTATGSNPQLGL